MVGLIRIPTNDGVIKIGVISSFEPVVQIDARVLILGTMPSVESLRSHQYYGNKRNQFWTIVYALFDRAPEPSYESRVAFLRKNRIALWDVLSSCDRVGSLDSNIRNEVVNDLQRFLEAYHNITAIFFNGGKAFDVFEKHIGFDNLRLQYSKMPSTSPANTISMSAKLREWNLVRELL